MTANRIRSAVVLAFLSFAVGVPSDGPGFSRHAAFWPGGLRPLDDDETREALPPEDEQADADREEGEP